MEPGLYAAHFFEAPKMTYPYGTHVAVVEVDAETGVVALRKYVITYDVGRAVNPMIVDGQLVGALGQGIGGALLEELVYDDEGQLLTTTPRLPPHGHEMPGRRSRDPEEIDPAQSARRQVRARGQFGPGAPR
jgi:carbon-monoxide dehydrogenase large subunit/6-hydroxypseudooxynicotine dehydrogenase subunit gamma